MGYGMIAIIIFVLVIIGEILFCIFRKNKWSLIRFASSIACLIIAFGIALIIAKAVDFKIISKIVTDYTFGGNITEKIGVKLIAIADKIVSGVIACFIQVILFWILKTVSYFVTRALIKKKSEGEDTLVSKVRFNPVGIAIGLICGIIYGGFTVMPYTGLMQSFESKETVTEITDILKSFNQEKAADIVSKAVDPVSRYAVKYTGIGFVTDADYNALTIVKTESGKVSLKELLKIITDNLGIVTAIKDPGSGNSGITDKISGISDAFIGLDILSDEDKLTLVSDAMSKFMPADKMPEYESVDELKHDLNIVSDSIQILEDSGININSTSISPEDVNISGETVNTLADNLYSLNKGEAYVDYALEQILGTKDAAISDDVEFDDTKENLVNVANAVLNINTTVSKGDSQSEESQEYINEQLNIIKDNNVLNDAGYDALLNLLQNNMNVDVSSIK